MAAHGTGREDGRQVRREVLGAEYVDRSIAAADEFTADLQAYLHDHCWGAVWVRPGLDRRTRSVVTLTALAAGGKWTEFKTHVRGALRNGWTPDELKEMFLQFAVYLGVPTAVEAFRAAQPIVTAKE